MNWAGTIHGEELQRRQLLGGRYFVPGQLYRVEHDTTGCLFLDLDEALDAEEVGEDLDMASIYMQYNSLLMCI